MSKADAEEIALALADAMSRAMETSSLGVVGSRDNGGDVTALQLINQSLTLTASCPEGGSIGVAITMTGIISDPTPTSDGGTGSLSLSGRETIDACDIGDYVVHGDPYVTLAATFNYLSWNLSSPATMSIGGAFRVTGRHTLNCNVQLTALMNANGTGRLSGQQCGQQIDKSY
jgi:hypothetical protein